MLLSVFICCQNSRIAFQFFPRCNNVLVICQFVRKWHRSWGWEITHNKLAPSGSPLICFPVLSKSHSKPPESSGYDSIVDYRPRVYCIGKLFNCARQRNQNTIKWTWNPPQTFLMSWAMKNWDPSRARVLAKPRRAKQVHLGRNKINSIKIKQHFSRRLSNHKTKLMLLWCAEVHKQSPPTVPLTQP